MSEAQGRLGKFSEDIIVIGLGNEFRRDDAVGLIAARRLRDRGIAAEEHEGDLVTLLDRWKGKHSVILIDAVLAGSPPGTLYRFDVSATPLDRELFRSSTHAFGLVDAVELSRTLGMLPRQVYVFGLEASDCSAGIGLSPVIEGALSEVVEQVMTCVAACVGAVRSSTDPR